MATATLTRPTATVPPLPVLFVDEYRALRIPAIPAARPAEVEARTASPADISMGDYLKYLEEDAGY